MFKAAFLYYEQGVYKAIKAELGRGQPGLMTLTVKALYFAFSQSMLFHCDLISWIFSLLIYCKP